MATKHSKATPGAGRSIARLPAISAKASQSVNIKTLRSQAVQVSGAIVAALAQCRDSPFSETTDQALEALLEKAGYVSDKMLKQLGSTQVCGSIECWMEVEEPEEAPLAEQASSTR